MTFNRKSYDIAGYTFRADNYCTECIIKVLPTGPDEAFDGWALAEGADQMSTEDNLDEIAAAFSIDRMDERTFDSDEFPKVIFVDQIDDDYCGLCAREI
jgi:hypothetical protein